MKSERETIPFSPPDITDLEIKEVIDTLKSGWITTGPKTKKFEQRIASYCGMEKAVCLTSATAGMELILRLFEIGEGDEVITTPFTFAATANIILHVGAKPVFADLKKDEFNIDPEKIRDAVTDKTKAVIVVDYGGYPADYDEINRVLEEKKELYKPKEKSYQEKLDKVLLISDAAHSFGAEYKGKKAAAAADFSVFSFHAVKNLTTAEGGAVVFNSFAQLDSEILYKDFMLLSLHGQSKDALAKMKAGGWKYSIDIAGYKYNMTDISASLGLVQLERYDGLLEKRKALYQLYCELLEPLEQVIIPPFQGMDKTNSFHLFPIRIRNIGEEERDLIMDKMKDAGISVNVHFIPLLMQPLYKQLGYSIDDVPNCYKMYENEITLPLYSILTEEQVRYICKTLSECLPAGS